MHDKGERYLLVPSERNRGLELVEGISAEAKSKTAGIISKIVFHTLLISDLQEGIWDFVFQPDLVSKES